MLVTGQRAATFPFKSMLLADDPFAPAFAGTQKADRMRTWLWRGAEWPGCVTWRGESQHNPRRERLHRVAVPLRRAAAKHHPPAIRAKNWHRLVSGDSFSNPTSALPRIQWWGWSAPVRRTLSRTPQAVDLGYLFTHCVRPAKTAPLRDATRASRLHSDLQFVELPSRIIPSVVECGEMRSQIAPKRAETDCFENSP